MRRWFKYFCLLLGTLLLISCGNSHDKNTLKVGTISGPETELMQTAKKVAKDKYNLDVEIVEFTDYVQPNASLNDGSIDANMFQHKPYLDQQIKDHQYKLVPAGKTFIYPMGIYSSKIKNLKDIKNGSLVGIPNDPSNEGRALLLLQKAKLITLKKGTSLYATPNDILSNPKQLKFKELDAAQLARSLPDLTIAVINTNYAIPAGLSPTKDAIFREDKSSPYVNLIVIREDETRDPRMQQFVSAFQSPEVIEAAKKIFNDQAIAGW